MPGQEVPINSFNISFNNDDDKFRSIACAVKDPTSIVSHQQYPGFSVVQVSKQPLEYGLCIGILYRKQTNSLADFYDYLSILIETWHIDILLGDFNINYFDSEDFCNRALSDFTMIVTEATHIDGALLDHVYVRKQLLATVNVVPLVKHVFYSDHDIVKIKLSKN